MKPFTIFFLGSRPISIRALEIVHNYVQEHPDLSTQLSVMYKSDISPPAGVVTWWKLGNLKKKSKELNIHILTERQLVHRKFDRGMLVFHNDIISQAIISRTKFGITNLHFGYLPSHAYSRRNGSPHKMGDPFSRGTFRGSNILSHAILQEEQWQAVTFHFITEKIDRGPIIEYAWNKISETTTAWDLQQMSEKKALSLFKKYIPTLLSNRSPKTIAPYKGKLPYFDRFSLIPLKRLSATISDAKLMLTARAFTFPNTEPAYIQESRNFKRYVFFKKPKGIVMLSPQRHTFILRQTDL